MEIKKTPKADLENKKVLFTEIGLIIALAVVLLAFEWKTYDKQVSTLGDNAAAVIGTPIAIGIAQQLQLPAEPFILAVLFRANMSYATPMAYKTNLLVMTAGGYTFNDFLRVGIPLTLIMWIIFSLLLPFLYNL